MWYSNFVHCFRYYCHESSSIPIQFRRMLYVCSLFLSLSFFRSIIVHFWLDVVRMRWRRPSTKLLFYHIIAMVLWDSLVYWFPAKQVKHTILACRLLQIGKKPCGLVEACVKVYTGIDKCAENRKAEFFAFWANMNREIASNREKEGKCWRINKFFDYWLEFERIAFRSSKSMEN